jgi:hypothetical protein
MGLDIRDIAKKGIGPKRSMMRRRQASADSGLLNVHRWRDLDQGATDGIRRRRINGKMRRISERQRQSYKESDWLLGPLLPCPGIDRNNPNTYDTQQTLLQRSWHWQEAKRVSEQVAEQCQVRLDDKADRPGFSLPFAVTDDG